MKEVPWDSGVSLSHQSLLTAESSSGTLNNNCDPGTHYLPSPFLLECLCLCWYYIEFYSIVSVIRVVYLFQLFAYCCKLCVFLLLSWILFFTSVHPSGRPGSSSQSLPHHKQKAVGPVRGGTSTFALMACTVLPLKLCNKMPLPKKLENRVFADSHIREFKNNDSLNHKGLSTNEPTMIFLSGQPTPSIQLLIDFFIL